MFLTWVILRTILRTPLYEDFFVYILFILDIRFSLFVRQSCPFVSLFDSDFTGRTVLFELFGVRRFVVISEFWFIWTSEDRIRSQIGGAD